ncbi:hypothetical protein PCE1_004269 [Barthelona sp. PCE]
MSTMDLSNMVFPLSDDDASKLLQKLLLSSWCMRAESCSTCPYPLMGHPKRKQELWCVKCGSIYRACVIDDQPALEVIRDGQTFEFVKPDPEQLKKEQIEAERKKEEEENERLLNEGKKHAQFEVSDNVINPHTENSEMMRSIEHYKREVAKQEAHDKEVAAKQVARETVQKPQPEPTSDFEEADIIDTDTDDSYDPTIVKPKTRPAVRRRRGRANRRNRRKMPQQPIAFTEIPPVQPLHFPSVRPSIEPPIEPIQPQVVMPLPSFDTLSQMRYEYLVTSYQQCLNQPCFIENLELMDKIEDMLAKPW